MKTHQSIILVTLSCLLLLISACEKKSMHGVSGVEDSYSGEGKVAGHMNDKDVSDNPVMPFAEAALGNGAVEALSADDFHDGKGEMTLVGEGQVSASSLGADEIGNNKRASRVRTRDQLMASGNIVVQDNVEGKGTHVSQRLRDVFFAYDSWRLSEQSHRILEANAKWLKAHPHARVLIEGHCDERGTRAYNYVLGDRRAEMAKQYLFHLGVPVQQMTVVSYGKDRPLCHVFSKACFKSNRRAHFSMDVNMALRD